MDRRLKVGRWHRRRRRRARRIALAALVAVIAIGIFVVLVATHRRGPARLPQVPVPTGAATRTLAWLHAGAAWTPTRAAEIRSALAATADVPAFPASTSMLVLDARDGRALYSRNADLALVPGSTVKLLTAAAALGVLGARHRFVTSLVSDGQRDGATLAGDVWLVGGGDPELTSDDLRRGVGQLLRSGVAIISGNVYADGSNFGPDRVSASWDADDLQYGWAAPASALSIDGGSVQFTITPRPGSQADVVVDPPGHRVIASVDTVGSDAENTLRIDVLPADGGYEVRGQIPYGAPQKYWRAVAHPTRAAAMSFLVMLQLAGIEVSGGAGVGRAPAQAGVLWQHRSRPLDAIVRHMFFLSDNHYAEQLLRAVGVARSGSGDLMTSLGAERSFMHDNGIADDSDVLADGSGLSSKDRATARSLVSALRYLATWPLPEPAYALLPRAGMEGTVAVRRLAPGAQGRVFAKDGYIEGASSIAGYVLTAHHGPVVFAFLVNDWEHGLDAVWAQEDRMLDLLAHS